METGDGLVLRVKPRLGILTLDQAGAIAALSQRFGSGDLDLTARANLQIRGVGAETFGPLIEALRAQELLDDSPEAEAVRNVVASPFCGIDPGALCDDIRPTVSVLQARLASDLTLRLLPAKWSIVVDQGGRFTLAGIAADMRFEATADGGFHVGLADASARGFCRAGDVSDAAATLCRQALAPAPSRMADVVATRGAAAVLASAGLPIVQPSATPPTPVVPSAAVGLHRFVDQVVLGIGAPFGALKAEDLGMLVALGRAAGARDIRLTPWRVLLLTDLREASARQIAAAACEQGLIVDPSDPRLTIAACSGAPACPRGTTPVRLHAEMLARALPKMPKGIGVHISGCAKGCAHPGSAPWTLVGHDGRYDLVRHANAGGAAVALGLTFQEVATWISRDGNPGRP
jgi:precorrin-3B synthase